MCRKQTFACLSFSPSVRSFLLSLSLLSDQTSIAGWSEGGMKALMFASTPTVLWVILSVSHVNPQIRK